MYVYQLPWQRPAKQEATVVDSLGISQIAHQVTCLVRSTLVELANSDLSSRSRIPLVQNQQYCHPVLHLRRYHTDDRSSKRALLHTMARSSRCLSPAIQT